MYPNGKSRSVTWYCRKSRKTVQLAPFVIEPLNRITIVNGIVEVKLINTMDVRQDEVLTYLESLEVYKLANVVRKGGERSEKK